MLPGWLIVLTSFGYVSLLFAIAYFADRRAERSQALLVNPTIYALSIAVFCTAWTFYGSVGRAASSGIGFLPVYLGPTLMFALGWVIFRKIIRISKLQRTTSIADFIASRYGKSHLLGGLVTIIAVVGILPYIGLQLKAVATSFYVLLHYPAVGAANISHGQPIFSDTALWIAALMALFSILFGTRHIDATEHHVGMVVAIAFESVVKLIAFMSVGLFVTFGIYDGFGDLFARAAADERIAPLMTMDAAGANWLPLMFLSMFAVVCLPRQFQVTVVENVKVEHFDKAVWLFPLYLLLINIFVLPIAFGGMLRFPLETIDADTFVLALPLAEQMPALALFAFIGGLSAATGMVIVETVALSTMMCNDLVMPILLRSKWLRLSERKDLSKLLLGIRRAAIIGIILLAYLYFRLIGESYALVTIGLVSFAAAAQFGPALIGGIYWKGGSRRGALAGMLAGFFVWTYTLLLPSFAKSGWLPMSFIDEGPFGISMLAPYALFGLDGLSHIPHSLFWSMLANIGTFVVVSLLDQQSTIERIQSALFVDVSRHAWQGDGPRLMRGRVTVGELLSTAERFLGAERARDAFSEYALRRQLDSEMELQNQADGELVQFVERRLSGAIGAASARVIMASTVKGEGVGVDEIMQILDETSHVLEYSRRLESKSRELEKASAELKAANAQLTELDKMKDDFLSTVTHELRTPLTSIRSFSEILHDSPDLDLDERQHFLMIIIRESERLTRLINQVLDLSKIESGRMKWHMADVDLCDVIDHAVAALKQLFEDKKVALEVLKSETMPHVRGDRDQLIQLAINLLSNAEKFCPENTGRVVVSLKNDNNRITVSVADNGPGIPYEEQRMIFEKFHQVRAGQTGNPMGSGLGLAICRGIVEHLGGKIWVESVPGEGATFLFNVPCSRSR
ncbi:MAG: histidine kinase [Hyphomicrobiales bacterium]|nr:histidine kinase [Hyphomicrobiales bacterium]